MTIEGQIEKVVKKIDFLKSRIDELIRFKAEYSKVPKNLFERGGVSMGKLIFVREKFSKELCQILGDEFFDKKLYDEGVEIISTRTKDITNEIKELEAVLSFHESNLEIIKSLEQIKLTNEEGLEIIEIKEEVDTKSCPDYEEVSKRNEEMRKSNLIDISEYLGRKELSAETLDLLKTFDSLSITE